MIPDKFGNQRRLSSAFGVIEKCPCRFDIMHKKTYNPFLAYLSTAVLSKYAYGLLESRAFLTTAASHLNDATSAKMLY